MLTSKAEPLKESRSNSDLRVISSENMHCNDSSYDDSAALAARTPIFVYPETCLLVESSGHQFTPVRYISYVLKILHVNNTSRFLFEFMPLIDASKTDIYCYN